MKRSQRGISAILFLITLLVVFAAVGYWWWSRTTTKPLGSQIYQQVKNPLKSKLSEVDAFQVKTNPFKDIYPNPFDRISK